MGAVQAATAGQADIEAARKAGVEAADLVIRAQMAAGMGPDRIQASAERVLGDRFASPTPASDAFYAAYDATAATYVAEMRGPGRDGDIEAG